MPTPARPARVSRVSYTARNLADAGVGEVPLCEDGAADGVDAVIRHLLKSDGPLLICAARNDGLHVRDRIQCGPCRPCGRQEKTRDERMSV